MGRLLHKAPLHLPSPDIEEAYEGIEGADSARFYVNLYLPLLELPRDALIKVSACCANNTRQLLGTVQCIRNILTSTYKACYQPLIVTSLGRAGTTWTMRLLSQHPGIVTYPKYPFEVKAATYWMQALKVLAAPADTEHSTDLVDFEENPYFIGHNPYNQQTLLAKVPGGEEVRDWLRTEYTVDLTTFFKTSVDRFYKRLAKICQKEEAVFFVEKGKPLDTRQVFWNIYENVREIILVRDMRDIFCSAKAFNAKRGTKAFGECDAADDYAWLAKWAKAFERLFNIWQSSKGRSFLVRYEDLLIEPEKTLTGLFDYAGLDAGLPTVQHVIQQASVDSPELAFHRTSKDPRASIGRWRKDLDPSIIDLCRQEYGDLLQAFGYSLD